MTGRLRRFVPVDHAGGGPLHGRLSARLQAIALPAVQRRIAVDPVAECRLCLVGFAERVVFKNALSRPC
ncbi:MAG: hypothetical protein RML45_05335 [Acetobacteraceae bacterium]|nr:hypothetical protein [Acetobacteraceae bacterium]